MVVHFFWLAAGDCIQCCFGIFHNALWVEIWERTFHKLVGVHDRLLLSEHPRHPAIEGEKVNLMKNQECKIFNSITREDL